MHVTKTFIQNINNIKYDDLPKTTIKAAKMAILDNIGNALGAGTTSLGTIYLQIGQGNTGCCTIWGTDQKLSAMEASFVNASLAQVLDCDDTYEIGSLAVSHPGPAVVAAAITVGEQQSSPGKDLIRAVVLGYEAAIRVAKAIEPRRDECWGFANTQVMGAVTAAGVLLGLNNEKMLSAYGTAVSCSPVPNTNMMWSLTERPMSWVKDGVGFATSTGVMCADLAAKGFYSTQRALDQSAGYYLLCGSPNYKEEEIAVGFDQGYALEKLSFKLYPTCRFMQSSLDSLKMLLEKHEIRNKQIAKIEVSLPPSLARFFSVYQPNTMVDAQFSIPYAFAMIIEGVQPSPVWYHKKYLKNPNIFKTARKVQLLPDSKIEQQRKNKSILSPKVKIVLLDGTVYEKQEPCAKGHPDKPFSDNDFKEKFLNMLPDVELKRKQDIINQIMQLEQCPSVKRVTKLLNLS